MQTVTAEGWLQRMQSTLQRTVFSARSALVLLVILAVALLIVPLPTLIIDIAVATNLLLAIYMLVKTLFIKDSLDLSTFPSLLLLTTIVRLSVSIATARSILSKGDAGDLVRTFGEFVVAGNIAVGLVIFVIISIVQFIVITKGGERIAEVSARFTLDALPGKQMSIDADLKAGDISREEARARRKRLQSESEFFGAMDGSMRFVKGDSIATMLVVAVNLIGGMFVGIIGQDLDVAAAAKTYSILSVGDGLVAQIPSILSCLAAGILATRVNGEDASAEGLGGDIATQLLNENRSLLVAAGAIAALGLAPGFPTAVLVAIAVSIASATLLPAWLKKARAAQGDPKAAGHDGAAGSSDGAPIDFPVARFNDPIRICLHPESYRRLESSGLYNRIQDLLKTTASDSGIAIQAPKFARSPDVPENKLQVMIEGVVEREIQIDEAHASSDLASSLVAIAKKFSADTFGLDDTHEWLESHSPVFPKLVGAVQAQLPMPILAGVLQSILRDGFSIAHPRALLQDVLAASESRFTVEELADVARTTLVPQVVAQRADPQGGVELVEIADTGLLAIESRLSMTDVTGVSDFEARERAVGVLFARLVKELRKLRAGRRGLLLVVPPELRSAITARLREAGDEQPVISILEADRIQKRIFVGKIDLQPERAGE